MRTKRRCLIPVLSSWFSGILDLPDVITPSSRDVSSPPGRSSDVGEQSSSGTSEDTTLPDEDVLGNQM
ncbi:unnamed protein product [Arctogadus glacialis]